MDTNSKKVAIVTGASRGIGAAIVERLAKDGFTVVINYAGKAAEAEALVTRIEQAGGTALSAQADVSDPKAVARMWDAADAAFGGVDVLVNNAGIMRLAAISEGDDALIDSQIAINLKGPINTMRLAVRIPIEAGQVFRGEAGHRSDLKPAGIPISFRPPD